jgi:hypothetical protein
LPSVLQEAELWVSSQDIGKGERWSESLWSSLSEIHFGMLMITKTNVNAPWIMFEAGALSKTVKSRVIPVLCNLERLDIASTPLAQFQNATMSKDELWQVVQAINATCQRSLDEQRLRATFDKWWPDFQSEFKSIPFIDSAAPKNSSAKDQTARLEKIEDALESIMRLMQRNEYERRDLIRRRDDYELIKRDDRFVMRRRREPAVGPAEPAAEPANPDRSGPTDPSMQN